MTARTKAPFRADVVGSLLRTAPLKEARAKREKGEINAAQLKEVEDREVEKIIKKQEEVGLKCATDGEFRRSWWHFDFYGMLDGVEIKETDHGIQFQGVQTRHLTPRIVGKLGFTTHPMLEHFKFLKAHTRGRRKCASRARRRCISGSSRAPSSPRIIRTAAPSSTIWPRPISRRSKASTTPAAAICNSTTPPGPILLAGRVEKGEGP